MARYNSICLLGNLTRDWEFRSFPNGGGVYKGGVAVNESFTRSDGTEGERVLFLDLDLFARGEGKYGSVVAKATKKGSRVLVSGKLRMQRTSSGEQTRTFYSMEVEEVQFLDAPASPERKAQDVAELAKAVAAVLAGGQTQAAVIAQDSVKQPEPEAQPVAAGATDAIDF